MFYVETVVIPYYPQKKSDGNMERFLLFRIASQPIMSTQVARRRRDYVVPMPISRHNRRRDGIGSLRKIDISDWGTVGVEHRPTIARRESGRCRMS